MRILSLIFFIIFKVSCPLLLLFSLVYIIFILLLLLKLLLLHFVEIKFLRCHSIAIWDCRIAAAESVVSNWGSKANISSSTHWKLIHALISISESLLVEVSSWCIGVLGLGLILRSSLSLSQFFEVVPHILNRFLIHRYSLFKNMKSPWNDVKLRDYLFKSLSKLFAASSPSATIALVHMLFIGI